jgi:diguanylate cyclase (GGDEF)-like protein
VTPAPTVPGALARTARVALLAPGRGALVGELEALPGAEVRAVLTEAGILALCAEWSPDVVFVADPPRALLAELLALPGRGQLVVLTDDDRGDALGVHAILPASPRAISLRCTVWSAAAREVERRALRATELLQAQMLALATQLGTLHAPESVAERALEGAGEALGEPGAGAVLALRGGADAPLRFAGSGSLARVESELDVPTGVVDGLHAMMGRGGEVVRQGEALVIGVSGTGGVTGALYLERSAVPASAHDLCGMFARLLGQSLSNAVLFRQRTIDALTGLYSREFGLHRLSETLALAARHPATTSVLALDVDHFKRVNDTFGHAGGDVVLAGLGELLEGSLRAGHVAMRLGGEEFLVVLPRTEGSGARIVAERLRRLVGAWRGTHGGDDLQVTVSIGVAVAEPGERDTKELIGLADEALYAAKAGGRNRVVCAEG